MKLFRTMFQVKMPGAVLPLLFAASVGAAFIAGHYVAEYDTTKREAAKHRFMQSSASADQLKLYASLLSQIRSGQVDGAIRVLEFQAHAEATGATECLSNQVCAALAASTLEKRAQLSDLVSAHAVWPSATTK